MIIDLTIDDINQIADEVDAEYTLESNWRSIEEKRRAAGLMIKLYSGSGRIADAQVLMVKLDDAERSFNTKDGSDDNDPIFYVKNNDIQITPIKPKSKKNKTYE